jgi:rod shape-determining protein MreD
LLYLIERRLLGLHGFRVLWVHELIRAIVNLLVAVPVFLLLDRWKRQE